MPALPRYLRAAPAALAAALIVAPAAHASSYGPAMSAADVRSMQTQGVREIVVKRAPGVSAAQQAAIRAQAGVRYAGPGPLPGTELDQAPAGQLAAAVGKLERDSQVQYAEPNGVVHATSTPNDPYFSQQWALQNTGQSVNGDGGTAGDDIGASYVWPYSTGSGVTVAVVDTGVDATAPDLSGQLVPGYSWVNADADTQDENGHGTHVSGIIAAAQNNGVGVSGVAPGAHVMPLQALDASGGGTDTDVAAAFNYAGDNNVPIVNASLGGTTPSQVVEQAIAAHPNTLYVVAAGNDGTDNDSPSTPFYPCDLTEANVICVGASDQNDQPASFSDYGPNSVDLFAPGVNILSTWLSSGGYAQYAYGDGTSMSTPMVSATLALMLARNPSLSAAQLKSDLLASVDPEPQLAGESVSGGELDAAAAVALAGGDRPYAAPGNRVRPVVSGSDAVGATLTVSAGSWSRAPTGYAYQWERCWIGLCVPIAGATSASYTVASSDTGASLYAVVTAGNAAGSTQATSTGAAQPPGTPASSPPPATSPASSGIKAATPSPPRRRSTRRRAGKRKVRVHRTRQRSRRPTSKRRKAAVKSRSGRSARS
ncbi:MAG TPA: S8 family peptidase [Solirubrobacteraceae bacterium]|nr:S8 family peptidase [Solirubrobacteraceae bacterium]